MEFKTKFVKYLDLRKNGVKEEVTVVNVKEYQVDGEKKHEIWFIRNDQLDNIDRRRLLEVLKKSAQISDVRPLYETMSEITLRNGVNALEYFNQYVKILYPSGHIERPKQGRVGSGTPLSQYT